MGVLLGGVAQHDIDHRVARFRTLPQHLDNVRFAVVSENTPPWRLLGKASPWHKFSSILRSGPEVTATLHLSATFDAERSAGAAAEHLTDHANFREGARKERERRARMSLRQAYCDAWGAEDMRHVLAEAGEQLALFSPMIRPELKHGRKTPSAAAARAFREARVQLRETIEVVREYHRVLWGGGTPPSAPREARKHAGASTGGSVDSSIEAPAEVNVSNELSVTFAPIAPDTIEEWHFHKYGAVRLLALDAKGNFCVNGAKEGAMPSLLSKRQWDSLGEALNDKETRVLVVASDVPFFLMEEPGSEVDVETDVAAFSEACDPLHWRSRPSELAQLMSVLFEWKNAQFPMREVLLLSGGVGFGTTGDVCDQQLGLSIPLVVVGPTVGPVVKPRSGPVGASSFGAQEMVPIPKEAGPSFQLVGSISNGRFAFAHRLPSAHWTACVVDIAFCTTTAKPFVDVQLLEVPVPPGTYV